MAKRSATKRTTHWAVPATCLGGLVAGTLFAAGHHVFYSSLDGNAVENGDFSVLGSQVPRQQINIAGGTAFAFLVNFCLGAAMTTAFFQVFWRDMLRRKTTLETLDATSSVISDLSQFVKLKVWASHPLLLLLAVIAWLIPIASIVTPGTLSVGTAPISPPHSSLEQVPSVGFSSLNYANSMPHISAAEDSQQNNAYQYDGPSRIVQRIANEVAAAGTVLPIHERWLNASWSLEFAGPGLQCNDVPAATRSAAELKIMSTVKSPPLGEGCTTTGYVSWSGNSFRLPNNATLSYGNSSESRIINLAAMPHMMSSDLADSLHSAVGYPTIPYLFACNSDPDSTPSEERQRLFANSTMMQCSLRNYTYHVSFEYDNGEQNVAVATTLINDEPLQPIKSVSGYYALTHSDLTNNNVNNGVDCTVLNGAINGNEDGASTDNPCSVNANIMKTLSYQAVFDAFETLVVGSASRVNTAPAPTLETGVNNTVLVDTPELKYLKGTSNPPTQAFNPLQQYIMRSDNPIFDGLVNDDPQVTFPPLKQTIEKLFENITVSMMSSAVLRPNPESAYVPPQVRVTQHNYHNVYVYSAAKLWIAYGLSLGFTAIGAAFGLWAVLSNGASYKGSFSTIFRIARGADIAVPMQQSDLDGKDPLPKHLGKSEVRLRPQAIASGKVTP